MPLPTLPLTTVAHADAANVGKRALANTTRASQPQDISRIGIRLGCRPMLRARLRASQRRGAVRGVVSFFFYGRECKIMSFARKLLAPRCALVYGVVHARTFAGWGSTVEERALWREMQTSARGSLKTVASLLAAPQSFKQQHKVDCLSGMEEISVRQDSDHDGANAGACTWPCRRGRPLLSHDRRSTGSVSARF